MSPTQRSLSKMRSAGYLCAVTEHWNQYAKIRQDLFGFIDILCLRGNDTLAIQSTSGDNVSHRLEKILQSDKARQWLESPTRRLVIHGWRKVGAKGKRKLWDCREVPVTLDMFKEPEPLLVSVPTGSVLLLPDGVSVRMATS